MNKINFFIFTSLNGFFKRPDGDINWHKQNAGGDENKLAAESLQSDNILLFGRKTFELMKQFWPTPAAYEFDPDSAKGMNEAEKIVFSNSLKTTDWQNSRIIGGDIIAEATKLKQSGKKDMTLLGSGSIAVQFADAGLIDTFQILIDPIFLPSGTSLFQGIKNDLTLKVTDSKEFESGAMLHSYELIK